MPDKKAEETLDQRAQQEAAAARKAEKQEPVHGADKKADKNARTEKDVARIEEVKGEITELQGELAELERKPVSKEDEKKQQEMTESTDHQRTANENVEAGGHPTGTVPGGTT